MPDVASVTAAGNLRTRTAGGFEARLRAGPVLVLDTDRGPRDDAAEVFLIYGGQVVHNAERYRIGGALTGRGLITEDSLDFGEATWHQLAPFGDVQVGGVRPGAFVRIPLDRDLRNALDHVAGFQLQVGVR